MGIQSPRFCARPRVAFLRLVESDSRAIGRREMTQDFDPADHASESTRRLLRAIDELVDAKTPAAIRSKVEQIKKGVKELGAHIASIEQRLAVLERGEMS